MLLTLFVTISFAYVGVCAGFYLYQRRLLYAPSSELSATPSDIGLEYEEVELTAKDGVRLHGWYVPHERPRAVVLYFHGNTGNISERLESLRIFHRLRLSTFILDYHGYGLSGGSPSEEGTYLDALAAWEYLVGERGIAPDRIIVFGRSLGAAVGAWLVARHSPRAAVIESAFTSLPAVAAENYPLLPIRWLARYRYDTLENIRHARCPVLVAHSRDDKLIRIHHGRALYEAVPGSKDFLEFSGEHKDGFLSSGEAYVAGVNRFVTHVLEEAPAREAGAFALPSL